MSTRKYLLQLAPIALFGLLAATDAAALTCTTSAVTINQISNSNGGGVISNQTINATSCYGVDGANDVGNLKPTDNLGYAGDGLLNGEGGYVSPTQFISTSQLQDLAGDGTANDPGWMFLGSLENGAWDSPNAPLDISSLLNISMTTDKGGTSGTWTITTATNIVQVVQAVLGRNAFDHLAIVLKAANGYVIYDFDFNLIGAALGGGFDFETAYSFTGTWENLDFTNQKDKQQALSHMSIWVRDPLPPEPGTPNNNEVPAPGTLALTALGLLLLGRGMRKRQPEC
ncbi:MAG: hypothetical protein LBV49_13460 [Azonexus sp.]|jgi:hypothetical protein|nr:hypothetical protein [Azonexus sp.]